MVFMMVAWVIGYWFQKVHGKAQPAVPSGAGLVLLHPVAHHLPVASHEALASRGGRGKNSPGAAVAARYSQISA